MQLPTFLTSTLRSLSFASFPKASTNANITTLPASALVVPIQTSLPTPFLPKRDEGQCLWPVKTWPDGGTYPDTVTVSLPCNPTPWNAAGEAMTAIVPQQSITTAQWPALTTVSANEMQPSIASAIQPHSQTAIRAAATNEPTVLGLNQNGVEGLVIVLPLIAVGLAIAGFLVGRVLGKKEKKKKTPNTPEPPAGPAPPPLPPR